MAFEVSARLSLDVIERSVEYLNICGFWWLPVCTILQLEEGKECVIVGTLYKHMKLKPCILDEYSKEVCSQWLSCFFFFLSQWRRYIYISFFFLHIFLVLIIGIAILKAKAFHCYLQRSATPLVKLHNFMHPDDKLVLEDDSGRVKLAGDVLLPSVCVTG